MTLLERIEYFIEVSQGQDDHCDPDEIINIMTPYQLLSEISDALEQAGVEFNTNWN